MGYCNSPESVVIYNCPKGKGQNKNKGCDLPQAHEAQKGKIMTTREYFQTVLDAHISDTMDEASRILIQKLDEKNAKRKSTPTKEQKEASIRRGLVLGFFQEHPDEVFTRDAVAEAVNVSPAQVTAACKVLLAEDSITKSEAKIDKTRRVVYQYKA